LSLSHGGEGKDRKLDSTKDPFSQSKPTAKIKKAADWIWKAAI
jgi:hypothetical protein